MTDALLLEAIVELSPHGICVFGGDQRVRLVNPAYNAIMDGTPVSVGDSLTDIMRRRLEAGEFHTEPNAQERIDEFLTMGKAARTLRRRRPNGNTVELRVMPLAEGGHMNVLTDVTALIDAESQLSERVSAMDTMLANIRHGIVLWDADGRVIAFNAVVHDILGMTPGFLKAGTTLEETIIGALERGNLGTGEVALRRAKFLREQDRSRSHVDQRLTQGGRVFEVRSDPTPGGGFVTTYTDTTSIREAEIALRQAKAAAEAANTGKSRFLAAMSQELRTPLAAIREGTDSLARLAVDELSRARGPARASEPQAADRITQAARAVNAAARTLSSVVDTILDVARLEAGRYELADSPVDVTEMVAACVRAADPMAAAAEVALVADLPAELPAVRGDDRRLRQALTHLVDNAIRFTGAMGSVSITAHHEPGGGTMRVEVADTGTGIADADLDRVFEPFVRGSDGHGGRPAPGAGLGLYVSRALLRAHGGDVILHSRAGHGTTAVMLVPACRVVQHGPDTPIRVHHDRTA